MSDGFLIKARSTDPSATVLRGCVSETRGVQKRPVDEIHCMVGHGIEGDAHAGD